MSKEEFILQVYKQTEPFEKTGVLRSLIIAMACLESGYGKSNLMKKANAFFGIKATSDWIKKGNKIYNSKTNECYDGQNMVSIIGCFRAYDNMKESVDDFVRLMNTTRYRSVVNQVDFKKAITAVKNSGYATDPKYVDKVYSIYKSNNLHRFDVFEDKNISKGDTVIVTNAVDYKGTKLRTYFKTYEVIQVNNDGTVVIGVNGIVFAKMYTKDVKVV